MKTKLVITSILSLLVFSSIWASPPGGAKMDEYMKKRFVYIGITTKAWNIDLKSVDYMVGDGASYTVHFKNGGSENIPNSATGFSLVDNSHPNGIVFAAWVEYLKFIKANPQFQSIP